MTTSAPQWPGQEGMSERREEEQAPPARSGLAQERATRTVRNREPADTVATEQRQSPHTLVTQNTGLDQSLGTGTGSGSQVPVTRSGEPTHIPGPASRQPAHALVTARTEPAKTLASGSREDADSPVPENRQRPSEREADGERLGEANAEPLLDERPALRVIPPDISVHRPQAVPEPAEDRTGAADCAGAPAAPRRLRPVPDPKVSPRRAGSPGPPEVADPPEPAGRPEVADLLERRRLQQRLRRAAARRNRFVVVRDAADKDLWAARRQARASLPSPVAVTRDIALALLEVEAGCRSAAQLERVFSPQLWEALEHRIARRGGPLPSGRSLMSVQCQEDKPGLADTVAVVRRGDLVRPVALRLDACGGRWTVTELRWWRNETDTATTPARDGGSS